MIMNQRQNDVGADHVHVDLLEHRKIRMENWLPDPIFHMSYGKYDILRIIASSLPLGTQEKEPRKR